MDKLRLITLTDGTDMGGIMIVFKTNAPTEELEALEKISNDVYLNGGDEEEVPIWKNVLEAKGYVFEYVDEHPNINAFDTSDGWLEKKYPQISEKYVIENQPELGLGKE